MTYAWDNDSTQNAHIKQMKDDRQKAYMEKHREDFKCPACGSTEIRPYDTEYREYDKDCEFKYCSDCGQKLDWSDEE